MVPYADGRPRLRRLLVHAVVDADWLSSIPSADTQLCPRLPLSLVLTSALSAKPFGPLHEAGPATAALHD